MKANQPRGSRPFVTSDSDRFILASCGRLKGRVPSEDPRQGRATDIGLYVATVRQWELVPAKWERRGLFSELEALQKVFYRTPFLQVSHHPDRDAKKGTIFGQPASHRVRRSQRARWGPKNGAPRQKKEEEERVLWLDALGKKGKKDFFSRFSINSLGRRVRDRTYEGTFCSPSWVLKRAKKANRGRNAELRFSELSLSLPQCGPHGGSGEHRSRYLVP